MSKKILIIDDSPIARKMLKSCLPKDKGYELCEAADGEEGIRKYQEFAPDLTFMDLTMPKIDGYQAINALRKLDKDAIIVVSTADIQRESMSRVINAGVFSVLRKPMKSKFVQEILIRVEAEKKKRAGGE